MQSHWSRTFAAKLAEHRDALVRDLATGRVADFPDYRQIVGRIQGLDDAIRISDEVDGILSGEISASS